jgi:hypothetical protein
MDTKIVNIFLYQFLKNTFAPWGLKVTGKNDAPHAELISGNYKVTITCYYDSNKTINTSFSVRYKDLAYVQGVNKAWFAIFGCQIYDIFPEFHVLSKNIRNHEDIEIFCRNMEGKKVEIINLLDNYKDISYARTKWLDKMVHSSNPEGYYLTLLILSAIESNPNILSEIRNYRSQILEKIATEMEVIRGKELAETLSHFDLGILRLAELNYIPMSEAEAITGKVLPPPVVRVYTPPQEAAPVHPGYEVEKITGFDPGNEPEIRLFPDGTVYAVFNGMPPFSFRLRKKDKDNFDQDMAAAIGTEVIWEDREFFLIPKPAVDTVARLKNYLENYRKEKGY